MYIYEPVTSIDDIPHLALGTSWRSDVKKRFRHLSSAFVGKHLASSINL